MAQISCTIYASKLCESRRKKRNEAIVKKEKNSLHITFCEDDSLEKFEEDLNILKGESSFLYNLKKRVSSSLLSFISVIVIMFALISASIYEDLLKKILFDMPFSWNVDDSLALLFVLLFFFGLMMMPSILDGESSQFKDILQSWINKDTRILKRLKLIFSQLDKKIEINLYNIDLFDEKHYIYRLVLKAILSRFYSVNFYVRNDQIKTLYSKLETFNVTNIEIIKEKTNNETCDVDILLSSKERKLYTLLQLSSSLMITSHEKNYVSLELFEYCGRNFLDLKTQNTQNQLISGFQNFVNRSFDDFRFLIQEKSQQIYFSNNVKYKNLSDEQRRLSYYLRNHIEECVDYFDNAMSLLILYYYVKDIVLDEKRNLLILEKFITAVYKKQQYEMIDDYWFEIAKDMFDPSNLDDFENTNNSIYRKLSIDSLNKLVFLFERNGHFNQALLLTKYLFEINPNKYSVNICSLYERMGQFDKAYNSLPKKLNMGKNQKPSDIEVRYFQRKAWIIVSQRKVNKKQEGLEAIKCLEEVLFSHNDDNEPLWLWHFYNIKANYAEWENDLNNAIENYKKCLSIPALGAFEYGATFVNMAIAYRFLYLTNPTQNLDTIQTCIKIGNIGLSLKESVGDRDEMPVVLHNQALNVLYKSLVEDLKLEELKNIERITDLGIEILDSTNSIKRLGMLLIENLISKVILKTDFQEVLLRLESHWEKMDENEHKQILNLYKCFKSNNKIKTISFLDTKP